MLEDNKDEQTRSTPAMYQTYLNTTFGLTLEVRAV